MGLTCASLHLFSPELSSGGPATSLGQLVEAAGGPLGYERIDNPEEAERHLIAAASGAWVSFFDLSSPDAVTEELVDLAKQLSAASHCPVLVSAVFDSDAFGFLVFEDGKQVDGDASTRGLLPGRIKKWPPQKRAQQWSRLFGRPINLEDVQALVRKEELFADDLLLHLCHLVGLSGHLATSTARDLQARPWPNQQELWFRSRPGVPGGFRVKQNVGYKGRVLARPIRLRGEDAIPFELKGPAEAFIDPVLEFSGPAVDAGIVCLSDGGHGLWALGMEAILAGDIRRVNAVVSSEEAEGRRVLRTCLKGLSAERFDFPPRKQSILVYWSVLRGIAPGTGELRVSCLPDAAAAERLSLRPVFLVEVNGAG